MGIEFNTESLCIRFPDDKRTRYLHKLQSLCSTPLVDCLEPHQPLPFTTIPALRSLLGSLVYIASLFYVGRTRLYHLFRCLRAAEHRAFTRLGPAARRMKRFPGLLNRVFLNHAALDDLRWYESILPNLPTRLLIRRRLSIHMLPSVPQITTDASGWGIGGYLQLPGESHCEYFSIAYSRLGSGCHSTFGELLALVIAVALWDHHWNNSHVRWNTDCEPHVYGLFKIRTSAPELLPLHDYLDRRAAFGSYMYAPLHLSGTSNVIADKLSRNIIEVPQSWIRCRPTSHLVPYLFGAKLIL